MLAELAPAGPDEVVAAVLAATGREIRTVESGEGPPRRERLIDALVGRDVTLVLDNCEHVIDEAAGLAEYLLARLPMLRILATSREPLSITGEAFVTLGPLDHPEESRIGDSRLSLGDFPAIELFRQRALAASGVDLSAEDLVVAATICARLDGLPLAIELAAAKLRTMSPAEVLGGLENRFSLLTGGSRTALPRHQTLRAMIDWSWSLLGSEEKLALAWLSVFPAGIDASDAGLVSEAMRLTSSDVFDSLVDRSLLIRSRGRFRQLETIREYGIERLTNDDTIGAARLAQAVFIAARAIEFDPLLRGPRVHDAIHWFDAEEDNIAAALRFAVGSDLVDTAVHLATACAWYWTIRDRDEDARTWFTAIAPLAERLDTDEARMIRLILPITRVFGEDADFAGEGAITAEERRVIAEELATFAPRAGSHELMQALPLLVGAFVSAGREEGWMLRIRVPRGEDLGLDPWPCAMLHTASAVVAQNRGDVAGFGVESGIAMTQFESIGDLWGLAVAQQMQAEWLMLDGRLDEALELAQRSTDTMRTVTSTWDLVQQQSLAISILMRKGDLTVAGERVSAMLDAAEHSGNVTSTATANLVALGIDVERGDVAAGMAHLARYDELRVLWPSIPPQVESWSNVSRAALAVLRGDRDAAELSLRTAATSALASHDHPVICNVALGIGMLALDRGDIAEALRALDLATAVLGTYDATALQVVAIERAARNAGIERPGAGVQTDLPSHSMALDALRRFADQPAESSGRRTD